MKKSESVVWHYVYRGTNKTRKEIYHGISQNIESRIDGSHCVGGTKTLSCWDCKNESIVWELLTKHKSQSKASEVSHCQEKNFKKRGYVNFITKGK